MAIPPLQIPPQAHTTMPDPDPGPESQQPDLNLEIRKMESNTIHHYTYPLWRKSIIVFSTSWNTLATTFTGTSLFSVSNEIASEFGTTPSTINIAAGGVILTMGFSTLVWGPIERIVGRKIAYNACIAALFVLTIAAALAPDLRSFVVLRVLAGLQGTYFHVAGQTIIAQYFPPTERGAATGWFLAGTAIGPPMGPFISGVIVTFTSWRMMVWLQVAITGFGLILSLAFIRHTDSSLHRTKPLRIGEMISEFNPSDVFRCLAYPNVLLNNMACGLLSWSMYALLSAPRHIIIDRFHLTSPLISGLFYISPAAGFLIGTLVGGYVSDITVRKWIARRDGLRLPQDRLKSGPVVVFLLGPGATLLFGWGLQEQVGGMPLLIVTAFFIAAALLFAFASLNTYSSEALPRIRPQVIASKYCIQYTCSAAASAASVPLIEATGVGWSSVISAVLMVGAGILNLLTARHGLEMQRWTERRLGISHSLEK